MSFTHGPVTVCFARINGEVKAEHLANKIRELKFTPPTALEEEAIGIVSSVSMLRAAADDPNLHVDKYIFFDVRIDKKTVDKKLAREMLYEWKREQQLNNPRMKINKEDIAAARERIYDSLLVEAPIKTKTVPCAISTSPKILCIGTVSPKQVDEVITTITGALNLDLEDAMTFGALVDEACGPDAEISPQLFDMPIKSDVAVRTLSERFIGYEWLSWIYTMSGQGSFEQPDTPLTFAIKKRCRMISHDGCVVNLSAEDLPNSELSHADHVRARRTLVHTAGIELHDVNYPNMPINVTLTGTPIFAIRGLKLPVAKTSPGEAGQRLDRMSTLLDIFNKLVDSFSKFAYGRMHKSDATTIPRSETMDEMHTVTA